MTIGRMFLALMLIFMAVNACAAQDFVYEGKDKRDPFMPLVTSDGYIVTVEDELLVSDMNLEGIILASQGEQSLAIINGKVVKVGENIGNYTVLQISVDAVELTKDTDKYRLELKKEE